MAKIIGLNDGIINKNYIYIYVPIIIKNNKILSQGSTYAKVNNKQRINVFRYISLLFRLLYTLNIIFLLFNINLRIAFLLNLS